MSYELSRRQVLKLVTYASAGTAVVGSIPLLSRFFADKANAQTTTTFVRENIYTFMQDARKVAALTEGVRVMRRRSDANQNDPTGWIYQANIHGVPTNETRRLAAWNSCQHGTFFFLSWHRMYLYYFERILRQASGDPTLALPYWNVVAESILPAPFRVPRDGNPLYNNRRGTSVNNGEALVLQNRPGDALRPPNFFHPPTTSSFGGRRVTPETPTATGRGVLENGYHSQVHSRIGGSMSRVEEAARDPIFWLHHANIDRLWDSWLRARNGNVNPTNDAKWMNDTFTFFDENSRQVQMSARDVLDTATQLNYVYDEYLTVSTTPVARSSSNARINNQQTTAIAPQELTIAGGDRNITFALNDTPLTLTSPSQNLSLREVSVEDSIVTLNVTEVEYDQNNPISYDIYINLPQGVAPNPNSPYYAGILSLFSLHQKGTVSLDITNVVSNLQQRNLLAGDAISITFVLPPDEKPRFRRRRGRPVQLQQAVRFTGITITVESL